MTEIPECWPPESHPELPLFALPNFCLFPYVILPVHIFEERYKEMIGDCLDSSGRIVLGTILPEHVADIMGTPPVYELAGMGEIGRHERRADGCYEILLVGLRRVRIEEVESDRMYRKVRAAPAIEKQPAGGLEACLRKQLLTAIDQRDGKAARLPENASVSHLADLLALRMPVDSLQAHEIFAELDVERRAMHCLKLHDQLPERRGPGEAPGTS